MPVQRGHCANNQGERHVRTGQREAEQPLPGALLLCMRAGGHRASQAGVVGQKAEVGTDVRCSDLSPADRYVEKDVPGRDHCAVSVAGTGAQAAEEDGARLCGELVTVVNSVSWALPSCQDPGRAFTILQLVINSVVARVTSSRTQTSARNARERWALSEPLPTSSSARLPCCNTRA